MKTYTSFNMKAIIRLASVLLLMIVGIGQMWGTVPTTAKLSFGEPGVSADFESASVASIPNNTGSPVSSTTLSGYGPFSAYYLGKNDNGNQSIAIVDGSADNDDPMTSKYFAMTSTTNGACVSFARTAPASFSTQGAFSFKIAKTSKLTIGLYNGSASGTFAHGNAAACLNFDGGSNIKISAGTNASVTPTKWDQIVSSSLPSDDVLAITVVYNTRNTATTYGGSIALAAYSAHVYINGTAADDGAGNAKNFSIGGNTITHFWLFNNSGSKNTTNTAKVDDIIIYDALPTVAGDAITLDKNNSDASGSTSGSGTIAANATSLTSGFTPPTRTGYSVEGYYTTSECATKIATSAGALQANITVDAVNWTDGSSQWKKGGAATFFTKWTPKTYTVTLNDNSGSGGSGSKTVTFNANTNMTSAVAIPEKTHYIFGGYWTSANSGATLDTKVIDSDGTWVASVSGYTDATPNWIKADDVTLYAKWTEHTYTNYRTVCSATYDITLDDGEVATTYNGSAKVAANGTQLTKISAPTKTGYKVEGYYAESGKTTLVAAADGTLEADVEVSSTDWTDEDGKWVLGDDATFYAKWEPISYEVRFNSNDENYPGDASGSMSNESYDYGESKDLTDIGFTLAGYDFAGWALTADGDVAYADEASVSNLSSTDDAVVDLYAIWTAKKYTLTLANTNATSGNSQTVQATYNSAMPLVTTADGTPNVAALSRTGYTFDGWEYNSTQYYSYDVGEDEISSAHAWDVANTATLTPRWNVNSYTLTWNLAGGTVTEAGTGAAVDATGTPSSSVNYGASITAPTVTKAGYTFAGWDVTPASTMPASNTTYTATWTEKTVTGWTWTNHRGGATITSDPIVIYVGQKVRMDIAYLPADVLSTHTVKENYDYTRSDGTSYLKQEAKASAYFTFSGKAAKSSTSITFTHTEDTSDPKAFEKTVNVEIRALPTDTYLDLVHGVSFSGPYGATLIDDDYGVQFTYTAPGGDVSDWSSSYANTCEQYHVHLIGWVESTWADEHLGDAEMPDTDDIISSGYYHPVGETMTVSGKTFYAVWAKVE